VQARRQRRFEQEPPDLRDMDEGEQAHEIYAWAGLALYYAQVFEQQLIHTLYVVKAIHGSLSAEFTSSDEFTDVVDRLTAGKVATLLRRHFVLSHELDESVRLALSQRNFLIHHYFSQRIQSLYNLTGRLGVLDELHQMVCLFHETDFDLTELMFDQGSELGFTPDLTEHLFTELTARAAVGEDLDEASVVRIINEHRRPIA
jgi:hypothetical protein